MINLKRNHIEFEYKMVMVTRRDLVLSPGKLAVQVAHAAVSCALLTRARKPIWFSKWQKEGAKKVVVRVDRVDDFFPLQQQADRFGILNFLVADAGHTEVPEGTQTVLGIGPAPSNIIDQVTGKLPLL